MWLTSSIGSGTGCVERGLPQAKLALVCGIVLLTLAPASAAALQARALLIGASDYAYHADLKAPGRDVADMRRALLDLGVPPDMVTVLDGVGGPAPTRRAILDGLDRLADAAAPGEFVVLYYSGHGTQIRDVSGDESDQRDEALVPVDAPQRMGPEDVVLDDQIRAALDRIRTKGAHVWAIFDSCVSGTVTRAASHGPRVKGITATALSSATAPAVEGSLTDGPYGPSDATSRTSRVPTVRGELVAFYASRPYESAVEMPLDDGRGARSVFTAALVDAMRLNPGITFRQLAEIVRLSVGVATSRQTPNAEGTGLDRPVPGAAGGPNDPGFGWWPLKQGRIIDVGWVGNVETGSVFSLHRTAALEPTEIHAKIDRNGALRSVLSHCRMEEDGTCARARPPKDAADFRYARLISPAVAETLGVSVVLPDAPAPGEAALAEALRRLIAETDWSAWRLSVVPARSASEARIVLAVRDGRVHVLTEAIGAEAPRPGRHPTMAGAEARDPERLARKLRGLWHIDRLRSVAAMLDRRGAGRWSWLSIDADVERSALTEGDLAVVDAFGEGAPESGLDDVVAMCREAERDRLAPLSPGAALTDCDRVTVEIASRAPNSVRVYLMHYGPRGCLRQVYPPSGVAPGGTTGVAGVLEPANATLVAEARAEAGRFFVLTRDPDKSLGRQGLIAIGLRLKDGRDPGYAATDYCSATGFRNTSDVVSGILDELMAGAGLRSGVGRWELADIVVDHLHWSVEPYHRVRVGATAAAGTYPASEEQRENEPRGETD